MIYHRVHGVLRVRLKTKSKMMGFNKNLLNSVNSVVKKDVSLC
jgi:hypothetical protein